MNVTGVHATLTLQALVNTRKELTYVSLLNHARTVLLILSHSDVVLLLPHTVSISLLGRISNLLTLQVRYHHADQSN
jgi:hypothetical protein